MLTAAECKFVAEVLSGPSATYARLDEVLEARAAVAQRYEVLKGQGSDFMTAATDARAEWLWEYLRSPERVRPGRG